MDAVCEFFIVPSEALFCVIPIIPTHMLYLIAFLISLSDFLLSVYASIY